MNDWISFLFVSTVGTLVIALCIGIVLMIVELTKGETK